MIGPSTRAQAVTHFLVMEVLERAQELESRGEDVVHLEVGEPDFDSPLSAIRAGADALAAGRTHYTHSLGIRPLRDAIAAHFAKEYGVEVSSDRVVVTIGSSAAIVLAFAVILDVGDEVVIADPGYPCYPNIARALGAVPRAVRVHPEDGFAYRPGDVANVIGPRTKAIVVNSPSNPTGTVLPDDVMRALGEFGPAIVSDEIYHGLVYEGTCRSALEFDHNHLVVGGFSKRYAMTGWRVGYLIVPDPLRRSVQALQQNLFISASDFAQRAALEALGSHDEVEEMRRVYDERRTLLLEALPTLGLPVPARPNGAFYVFADASRYSRDSMGLALDILDRAKVAVAPGIDFGLHGEGFLRFSYATARPRIEEGIERLRRYFAQRDQLR